MVYNQIKIKEYERLTICFGRSLLAIDRYYNSPTLHIAIRIPMAEFIARYACLPIHGNRERVVILKLEIVPFFSIGRYTAELYASDIVVRRRCVIRISRHDNRLINYILSK